MKPLQNEYISLFYYFIKFDFKKSILRYDIYYSLWIGLHVLYGFATYIFDK